MKTIVAISAEITYRPAELTDAAAIFALNQQWCGAFTNGFKEKGFLKNSFDLNQIRTLILSREVVVAISEGKVIGYYLVNSIYETNVILNRKELVRKLIDCKEIEDARYVYLTQAAIELDYMGKGVAKELLKHLKLLVQDRFDYLIGYIDNENLNAKEAHLRSGWYIFAETPGGFLAITPTVGL